jgi:DNA-binding NtrC family response regulator
MEVCMTDPPKILVAEDDEDFRDYIVTELRRAGYHVVAVEDGSHLVEYLGTAMLTQFDMPEVVVADIRMPGPSGLDVTRALDFSRASTGIILMTAFGNDELHASAERAGAIATLDKPFDVHRLLELLSRELERRGLAAPSAPAHGVHPPMGR